MKELYLRYYQKFKLMILESVTYIADILEYVSL